MSAPAAPKKETPQVRLQTLYANGSRDVSYLVWDAEGNVMATEKGTLVKSPRGKKVSIEYSKDGKTRRPTDSPMQFMRDGGAKVRISPPRARSLSLSPSLSPHGPEVVKLAEHRVCPRTARLSTSRPSLSHHPPPPPPPPPPSPRQ